MNRSGQPLRRLRTLAILFSFLGTELNCSHRAATSSPVPATSRSTATCYNDGIGCGIPALGAVHLSQLFTSLPVQTTAGMYAKARQAGLKVDRIGTYWDWFMDRNGHYDPSSSHLQNLDSQISADLANGVIPEFLLGTEAPNHMPAVQGPNNLPVWNYYPTEMDAFRALADVLAHLVARFPTVKYWELFNEMDSAGFTTLFAGTDQSTCPMQRGVLYGQMLNVVVPAAKRVNPTIHIVMGGMGGASDIIQSRSAALNCEISFDRSTGLPQTMADFLKGIYRVGAGSQFDIVNAHAYADSTFGSENPRSIGMESRWTTISESLHRVILSQGDSSKQFWITEFGTSGVDDITSGACPLSAPLGPCMDRAQVNVLGNVINALMQHDLFDVAIIYAICAGAGGTPDPSYDHYLPRGMSVNDYGFQILRSDNVTPRPMFNWLIQRNICLGSGGKMFTTDWTCQ
jgi:hypothetical protein